MTDCIPSDPVTMHTRPVTALLGQAAEACRSLQLSVRIYQGTSARELVSECATVLTESGGYPAAVIAYGGSDYGNAPRRTSEISIFLLAAKSRVNTPVMELLDTQWKIADALDDVITQDSAEGYPITDKWKLVSDEVLDLSAVRATAAMLLTFDVEDY